MNTPESSCSISSDWSDECNHSDVRNGYCEGCGLCIDSMEIETVYSGINNQYTLENYIKFIDDIINLPNWLRIKTKEELYMVNFFPLNKEKQALKFVYNMVRRIEQNSVKVPGEPFSQKKFEDEIFKSHRRSINQAKQNYNDDKEIPIMVKSPLEFISEVCKIENLNLNRSCCVFEGEIIKLAREIIKLDVNCFFLEISPEHSAVALYKIIAISKDLFYNRGFANRHSISENILKTTVETIKNIIKSLKLTYLLENK